MTSGPGIDDIDATGPQTSGGKKARARLIC